MITIQINGEDKSFRNDGTLQDLLQELDINNRYCAVERNMQLVPREDHAACRIQEGDHLEIVTLVGGG